MCGGSKTQTSIELLLIGKHLKSAFTTPLLKGFKSDFIRIGKYLDSFQNLPRPKQGSIIILGSRLRENGINQSNNLESLLSQIVDGLFIEFKPLFIFYSFIWNYG